MRKGLLVVLSGPSGVGKDTLVQRLLQLDPDLRYSVSATTRPPRVRETPGENYTFVTRERFEELMNEGAFLEHATYNGELYGTFRERVEKLRYDGKDVLLKIEVNGAQQIRATVPGAVLIFITAPSSAELERRQERRGTETREDLVARRRIALHEMSHADSYDYQIVNEQLEDATDEILGIIREARTQYAKSMG